MFNQRLDYEVIRLFTVFRDKFACLFCVPFEGLITDVKARVRP